MILLIDPDCIACKGLALEVQAANLRTEIAYDKGWNDALQAFLDSYSAAPLHDNVYGTAHELMVKQPLPNPPETT